jgi:hypothetical protein
MRIPLLGRSNAKAPEPEPMMMTRLALAGTPVDTPIPVNVNGCIVLLQFGTYLGVVPYAKIDGSPNGWAAPCNIGGMWVKLIWVDDNNMLHNVGPCYVPAGGGGGCVRTSHTVQAQIVGGRAFGMQALVASNVPSYHEQLFTFTVL